MPWYRVKLRDGRTVRVEAANPQAADAAGGEFMRANPRPGLRGQEGYAKARARVGQNQQAAQTSNAKFPGGNVVNASNNFTRRVAGSTGAADEVAGAVAWGTQGAENIYRRATGRPIESTAQQAYMAAQDTEREWQESFARENPGQNIFATGLGILATARPTGGATISNPFRAGAAAAAQNAPFAVARQDGNLRERAPGAATETAMAFGMGSALTAGGQALAGAGARARARPPSPQRRLSAEGVQLTPGQMLGGAAQRTEDAMTSVPVIGDAIRSARVRGIESFDRAALNRSLAPIGGQLAPDANVGRDGVRAAEQAISSAYDNALDGVVVRPDSQFGQDITQALHSRQLPPDAAQEVDAVLSNIADRARGPMDGRIWKELDSEIRTAIDAADNASGQRPSMRYVRDTLRDVRTAFRGVLDRSAPQALQGVREADEATANLARIRQASQYTGTSARGGVFSPADLNRAVQGLDNSAGNREFARGDALMQDLTEPAMQVLPQTVPDSGTPIRSLFTAGGAGGGLLMAGVEPGYLATAGAVTAATSGAYSRPVQDLVNAIYRAKNPGAARELLGQLGQLAGRDPALVPVYTEAALALGVPLPSSSRPPSPQGRLQGPTTP